MSPSSGRWERRRLPRILPRAASWKPRRRQSNVRCRLTTRREVCARRSSAPVRRFQRLSPGCNVSPTTRIRMPGSDETLTSRLERRPAECSERCSGGSSTPRAESAGNSTVVNRPGHRHSSKTLRWIRCNRSGITDIGSWSRTPNARSVFNRSVKGSRMCRSSRGLTGSTCEGYLTTRCPMSSARPQGSRRIPMCCLPPRKPPPRRHREPAQLLRLRPAVRRPGRRLPCVVSVATQPPPAWVTPVMVRVLVAVLEPVAVAAPRSHSSTGNIVNPPSAKRSV